MKEEDRDSRVGAAADEALGARARNGTAKTRKSAATRERIMSAAAEIMVERRSTDFQMSEVSERCQMSKGALYYYFSDRDELVSQIFAKVLDETVESIEGVVASSDSAHEALVELCHEFVRLLQTSGLLALALTHEFSSSARDVVSFVTERMARVIRVIAEQIELAKSEGAVREDVDATLASVFVTGGFVMTSLATVDGGLFAGKEDLATELFALGQRGFGASRGGQG